MADEWKPPQIHWRMGDGVMARHMHWRKAYERNRFCRHLPETDLQQRIRDIVLNMMVLTPGALIGLGSPDDPEAQRWMVRWTQVLHEMQLRHGPYPNGFTDGFMQEKPIPDFVGELGRKAARVFADRKLDPDKTLIKYGKPEHLGALLSRGLARVQPASFFMSSDLNGAVGDDELNLAISLVLSREEIIGVVQNPQDVPPDAGDQVFEYSYRSESDYWLYCVTRSHEPRLFVDFDATACVVIKNRDAFAQRLQRAASLRLPATTALAGVAMYVDPHQPDTARIQVPLAKHFRYTYQKEYRFAWLPTVASPKLAYVDIEMGPLDDIAELVEL